MNAQIENVKNEFLQAKVGLLKALSTTPEERLNWSPSPTARTPLEVAVHTILVIGFFTETLNGRPFVAPTTAEADRSFREAEKCFTSRDQVLRLLDEKADAFVACLDGLAPERLGDLLDMPFGLDPMPVAVVITIPAMHMRSHIPQIEYIQTIYGDRDWHM